MKPTKRARLEAHGWAVGSTADFLGLSAEELARRSSGNVFRDLGFDPREVQHLRIRPDLMIRLNRLIAARQLTQKAAAALFGVSQPRVSDLVRGRIDRFSVDTLIEMLGRAGVRVRVSTGKVA